MVDKRASRELVRAQEVGQMNQFLDDFAASEYLNNRWGVKASRRTLQNWRWNGEGPAFYKARRFVRYSISDLDAFGMTIIGEPRTSTSATDTAAAHA
jgi:hypothetical protein